MAQITDHHFGSQGMEAMLNLARHSRAGEISFNIGGAR